MMKKFLFAICSICLAASAVAAPLSAFAAGELPEPDYPEIFDDTLTFENLTDFAIASDNLMAFADGQTIVYLKDENTTVYEFEFSVANVDYENGNFYYSLNGSTESYILPDSPQNLPGEQAEHDFSAPHITQTAKDLGNGFIYYYDKDDLLIAVDKETRATQPLNLSNAKIYSGKLYGILANNFLYEIAGQDAEQVNINYSNYDKLKSILVGDIPEKLHTYEALGENPKYVYIEEGAWVTEIDLNLLLPSGDDGSTPKYFPISQPKEKTYNDVSGPALLLCDSGTVRIVAQGRMVYIMNIASATPLTDVEKTPLDDGTTSTVIAAGEYAHSFPFMSNATRTFALAPNEVVTVLYEVSDEALAHKFYVIENAKGERGYVIDEFLGDFNVPVPDEGGTSTTPDPDPQTESYIKIVVLIIIVIILVLIAAGYLTWIGTRKQQNTAETAEGEIDLHDAKNNNDGKIK